MDINKAIQFAQLVNEAYKIRPDNVTNAAGNNVAVTYGGSTSTYKVITSIYACDLATEMNPDREQGVVSIGLVLQADSGDVVIAVRGTEGILEWIHDAEFGDMKCPFPPGAGNTEDGFTEMYQSMSVNAAGSPRLVQSLEGLAFSKPVSSVTICGHSLGGALATLLALDVATNTRFKNPTVYTYASPKTGDPAFVAAYNQAVPNTFRVANRVDLVPKLPLPPEYEHVLGLFEVNPIKLGIPPKMLIKLDVRCEHVLNSYLYLLSLLAAGGPLQLETTCAPS